MLPSLLAAAALASQVAAQESALSSSLSLPSAIALALEQSPSMVLADAAADASEARIAQARAALLPRVDFVESATRSDNPVFVFGSRLNQGRFGEADFALDALNNPDPLSLFQSRFVLEQTLFAGGRSWNEMTRAKLGRDESLEASREAEMNVIYRVLHAYFAVLVAEKAVEVADDALGMGEEDLRSANVKRQTGLATDADVLALEVQLSELEERRIVAGQILDVAWMELNAAMGAPLETSWELLTPLTPESMAADSLSTRDLEAEALQDNPELRRSTLQVESAEIGRKQARAAFLPSVGFHASWESDRVSFTGAGGTNWMLGVSVRMNLFNGLGDKAGVDRAEAELRAARAREAETRTRLHQSLREAELGLEAANKRLEVSRGARERARESHRITRARYEGGLANVTDLLRSQNALMASELREAEAAYETRLSLASLERLLGTLDSSSEAVQP